MFLFPSFFRAATFPPKSALLLRRFPFISSNSKVVTFFVFFFAIHIFFPAFKPALFVVFGRQNLWYPWEICWVFIFFLCLTLVLSPSPFHLYPFPLCIPPSDDGGYSWNNLYPFSELSRRDPFKIWDFWKIYDFLKCVCRHFLFGLLQFWDVPEPQIRDQRGTPKMDAKIMNR